MPNIDVVPAPHGADSLSCVPLLPKHACPLFHSIRTHALPSGQYHGGNKGPEIPGWHVSRNPPETRPLLDRLGAWRQESDGSGVPCVGGGGTLKPLKNSTGKSLCLPSGRDGPWLDAGGHPALEMSEIRKRGFAWVGISFILESDLLFQSQLL